MSLKERDLFREPLSKGEIRALLGSRPLEELFSRRSIRLKALDLKVDELSNEEKLEWMAREPALLRRPIVVVGEEMVIGFDAKRLAQLFP